MNNKQTYNSPIIKIILFMLLISAYSYAEPDFHLLMTLQGESPGDAFSTVVGLGDFNQDGYDDFAVGAWDWQGNYVNIYYGSSSPDTNAILKLTGKSGFGRSLASGDFNGDGVPDLIVGAPYANGTYGQVSIYFGGEGFTGIPDIIIDGTVYYAFFGISIANAGDINGDGYEDFIIGADAAWETTGYVYIYFGGPEINGEWDYCFEGLLNERIGYSIDGLGDINHDGYDDIIVGTFSNKAYIIYGNKTLCDNSIIEIPGDSTGHFGRFVSSVGDINNNITPEYLIKSFNHVLLYSEKPDSPLYIKEISLSSIKNIIAPIDFNKDEINDLILVEYDSVFAFIGNSNFCIDNADYYFSLPADTSYKLPKMRIFSYGDIGDINGDGTNEIAFGFTGQYVSDNPHVEPTYGKVFIYTFGEYSDVKEKTVPTGYHLKQNYPNPFNARTTITFTIQDPGFVELSVYDIKGSLISVLEKHHLSSGNHTYTFDAEGLSSGIYLYKLSCNNQSVIKKMAFIK